MNPDELERMHEMMADGRGTGDWVMPGVLLLVGMPLVLLALWMAASEAVFRLQAEKVQGVVVDRQGSTPQLLVEYRDAGGAPHRTETFGSDLYKDVEVGHKVGVYMSRRNPDEAHLAFFTDAWMLPLILGAFGSFFAIPGLFFARSNLRAPLQAKALKQNGRRIQAEVVEIQPAMTLAGFQKRLRNRESVQCTIRKDGDRWHMTINGEEHDPFAPDANSEWGVQYRVLARWQDPQTGQTHQCESEAVDVVPATCLQFGTVTVLVDPDNPQNCRVELS